MPYIFHPPSKTAVNLREGLAKLGEQRQNTLSGGELDFQILGPLEVSDGRRVLPIGGARQRGLLAILLLNANRIVLTARLMELLWDGEAPQTAANAIQVYVAHLRRLLEPDRSPAPYRILVHHPQGYELRVHPDQVDAQRFENLVRAAARARDQGHWQLATDRLGAALALWRGPALAEFASERFAVADVARLEELRLRALEDRIDADLKLGRHTEIVPELRALVAEHPLRERLCAQLMLALYRAGLQAQASDVYHRTRARLLDELGMEPGPLLERLFRDILKQAGYLEATAPGQVPNNLPHSLTRFIGRGTDLAQLIRRLEAVRLLTLTGAGGIGKTRLAIELARHVLQQHPDGTWLIDLAPISDPELIAQRLAAELKLHEQPGRPLIDTLAAHLRDRRALLLLDNCERVLDASADFAAALLSRCSALTVLATSRQRLGMVGEQVWQVSPLSVPDSVARAEDLMMSEAIQLFLDRAALVQPDFQLSESNAAALVQICRRLDGIPLALELAAAQMASLSTADIAAKLDDRFSLLVAEERGRPARHQTLAAALEWSHHLLDQSEQVVFRRLGVFSGGFDVAAIQAVCSTPGAHADLAPPVRRLVEKSLVLSDATEPNRFRMLETMRDFAKSRAVATSESQRLGRKHAEYFLTLVQAHGGKLRSKGAIEHLGELDRNIDNLRTALEWASAHDRRLLERLAVGLHSYWMSRCSFREGLIWLNLALGDRDSPLWQPLLASAGWLELASGQLDLGLDHSQQALAAAQASSDGWGEARALMNLCEAHLSLGDMQASKDCLDRAVAITERVQRSSTGNFQDQALVAGSWCMLGRGQMVWGPREAAKASLLRGIDLAARAGDYFCEALGSCWHSEIAVEDGDLSSAADLGRHGLELAVSIDHRFIMVRAVGQLAAVAAAKDMPARALKLAAAVDSVRSAIGARGFDEFDFWFGRGWPSRLQQVRDRLGPDQVARIWEEGSRLSLYEAAAIGLGGELEPEASRLATSGRANLASSGA